MDYLLYHDAIDAHVYETPGVVEYVHPAESKAQYQEAQVLFTAEHVQYSWQNEEEALQETVNNREIIINK